MKSAIAIFCLQNHLAAWRLGNTHAPQRIRIEGQDCLSLSALHKSQEFTEACGDITARLQDDGFAIDEVHWVLDKPGGALWQADVLQLSQIFTQHNVWQIFSWPWLATRFELEVDTPWATPNAFSKALLPWLANLDTATDRKQMQQVLTNEHQTESEQLFAERTRLRQENEQLRSQNAALGHVDAENLVRFLPALFPRVFTVLGATDLALLSGRVEPLSIPNPYPEPSEETLRTLQKHFRALPQQFQQQIVRFVARLPQRYKLQPRPEMRELVLALEES